MRSFYVELADADEVIDLAYATVPKTSFDDPVNNILTNMPPTLKLLEVAGSIGLNKVVLVSSGGTVYGRAEDTAERGPSDKSYFPIRNYKTCNRKICIYVPRTKIAACSLCPPRKCL